MRFMALCGHFHQEKVYSTLEDIRNNLKKKQIQGEST